MNALLQGDVDLAEEVVAGDDAVDALELRIDEQCERILALHSPVAVDLRMLIMAVKINTDFERIGATYPAMRATWSTPPACSPIRACPRWPTCPARCCGRRRWRSWRTTD